MLKIPWEPRLMNFAKPVCLPDQGKRFLGINCVATGWGQIEKHGQLQDQLRQVQLSVIENSHCQDMYHMKYDIDISNETHLCAGPILAGGKGTCVVSSHKSTYLYSYFDLDPTKIYIHVWDTLEYPKFIQAFRLVWVVFGLLLGWVGLP